MISYTEIYHNLLQITTDNAIITNNLKIYFSHTKLNIKRFISYRNKYSTHLQNAHIFFNLNSFKAMFSFLKTEYCGSFMS